uniref:Uncharacterized protein n=1 Tax=Eutreptiella gymnastica TaxID=73025 RepID=A0A7S4GGZ2_9EUGL|mmetsp:Transcript_68171/g.114611  ORF Transcript_68171/g.114611 Transcript_68171/m.114611 type:complete len:101 (+) Transcript_68171:300-602(+)
MSKGRKEDCGEALGVYIPRLCHPETYVTDFPSPTGTVPSPYTKLGVCSKKCLMYRKYTQLKEKEHCASEKLTPLLPNLVVTKGDGPPPPLVPRETTGERV